MTDATGRNARTLGGRLRELRTWRDLSLRATAELAGLSESHLSRIERGERPVDRRSTLEALARALQVAPSELTGQPYEPSDRGQAAGHTAASALRAVLRDIELSEPTVITPPRSVEALRPEVAAVLAGCSASDYGAIAEAVPTLLGELHAAAEAGSGQARVMLAEVLHAAFYLAKDLGHGDLAWMVAGHLHGTAQVIGDPRWVGLAEFVRSHAVVGDRGRFRSLSLAQRGAATLVGVGGEAEQVRGMLHLSAALHSAALRRPDVATEHLGEAADLAGVTGEGTFAGLHFGPRNVGVWRVALAVELGEGGRVGELARSVDVSAIPSAGRRAMFYADLGRGLATERTTRDRAVIALRKAEDNAPQLIRSNFYVREAVTNLLGRSRGGTPGRELRGMAYRMGLAG